MLINDLKEFRVPKILYCTPSPWLTRIHFTQISLTRLIYEEGIPSLTLQAGYLGYSVKMCMRENQTTEIRRGAKDPV